MQRWFSLLLTGDDGLEKLDDAKAPQAVRGAHSAYCNFEAAEVRKAATEGEIQTAGSEPTRALKGYGKLRGFDVARS